MRIILVCILGMILGVPDARAQQNDVSITIAYRGSFTKCMDSAGGVTARMHQCMDQESQFWDKRLNAAYIALMASDAHSASAKAKLKDAQLAWIAFRDKGCLAAGDLAAEGGTLSGLTSADCSLSLTAQRAAELEAIRGSN